ncbi:MAG: MBL fold metallo-hydrolase [Ignavibacteria bacterium]|nr:MBL fold metallo-hydrolase [Ignavibacteria bacterium]
MIKRSAIILFILFTITIIGCWPVRVGMKSIGESLFGEPEKVKNKIKDPVKENVRLSALWVGHSTVLLQIEDKVILVDPVFEDVISGIVLRKVEAGLNIKDIPKLDIVAVSHAHMDHMSLGSLKDLDKRFPKAKLFIPYGSEEYLPSYDMEMIRLKTANSKELGYIGESKEIDGVKITAVFAQHQGGRYGMDSYTWMVPGCTGYIIEYKGITVFYAGDTTYDEFAYKYLGTKFKIDLALIPVGPCRDCETDGSYYHLASLGALKVFDELKADYMIPVHYGALEYFDDPNIPVYVLHDLATRYGSSSVTGLAISKPYSEGLKILKEGEQYVFQYK